ncbi:hypothetical protein, partial [Pseudoalteromonas sp. SIMBA_162]|uniref:hypothetical protein n=1 Tax=Pseudoalteromonas sp. SIMBA_162 TaxID=3080867 RepID=UPI00397E0716
DSASNSKKGRLYVNSTNGRLFVTDSETLRNWKECGINLYKDVYEQNFNEVTNGNCLFDTESVHNITSYLFNKNDPNLYKTNLVEPFDVENMVKIGK